MVLGSKLVTHNCFLGNELAETDPQTFINGTSIADSTGFIWYLTKTTNKQPTNNQQTTNKRPTNDQQPYAQVLCETHVYQGLPQGYVYKGGAPSGRPPVEESLVDILEEDPGAHGFRIGLAHRAVGRLLVVCWPFG